MLMTNSLAVKAFIGYFQIRSTAGTVMCKAMHLIQLAKSAYTYFSSLDDKITELAELSLLTNYLRSIARANKTESRRQANSRKEDEYRSSVGKVIILKDFQRFCRTLLAICTSMITGSKDSSDFASRGPSSVRSFVQQKRGFVEKWNLHFLSLCIMFGGGQRPQVFTLLENANDLGFQKWDNEIKEKGYFSVKVSNEKRIRAIELPHVLFSESVLECFKFHIKYILPALYRKHKISDDDARRNYMFLHTKTGDVLDSANVTSSLRTFLKTRDPEMKNVTTMDVRSSFASMMLGLFRKGKAFQSYNEAEFLDYLAKLMNTSYEQLRDTYISTRTDDFHASLSKVLGVMDTAFAGEDLEDESDSDTSDSDMDCDAGLV